jgi:hypothetical protein
MRYLKNPEIYRELPNCLIDQYYIDVENNELIRASESESYVYYHRGKEGYFLPNIFDIIGDFYLVHPFENEFERDEFSGLFINFDKSIKKVDKMYNVLFNQLFKLRLITIDNNTFIKTELWTKMNK